MAVRINVPGVGQIDVEGVASEAVMEKILAQLKAMDPKAANSVAAKAQAAQTEALKKSTEQTQQNTKAQTAAEAESQRLLAKRREAGVQLGRDVAAFTTSLASNATRLSAQLMKMHETVASDPIGTGASLLNVGIDMLSMGAKSGARALQGLGSSIPIVGGLISGLGAAAEVATEALAAAAKVANAFLSQELKNTANSMKSFTAAGASFAGGLTELRTVAHGSGLNLTTFTNVVKSSRESISGMGLTVGDASYRLGKSMQSASVMTGRSGQTLRDEMLNMGYSYEEQGVIMAQYMSMQKASGNLEKMTREQIAEGTRKYAADLKVLADITGQDAKKIQERARTESMRGALQNQLVGDQKKAFTDAYSAMMALGPEMGPKLQSALTQMMAGGTVTDPVIAGNAQIMEMLTKTADGVRAGNQNMITTTQSNLAIAAQEYQKVGETATDVGAAMGVNSPLIQSISAFGNALRGYKFDPDAAQKSADAANKQAETADAASKGFSAASDAAMKFSREMEKLATVALPSYSKLLGSTMQGLVEAMRKLGIDVPKTEMEIAEDKKKQAEIDKKLALENAVKKAKAEEREAYKGASILQRIGFGRTDAQKAATENTRAAMGERNRALYGEYQEIVSPEDLPQYAGGGILSGPKSGYRPNIMMHGTEAIVPLENEKIPIQFEADWYDKLSKAAMSITGSTRNSIADGVNADWYDKLSKAAMLITGSTRNSIADGVNISESFGKALVDNIESATAKIRELEQSESGRSQVNEIMKSYAETLLQLKEGRDKTSALAGLGAEPMIDAQNKMIMLFEQFLTKQDEAKAELERARIAQEMMRDLM